MLLRLLRASQWKRRTDKAMIQWDEDSGMLDSDASDTLRVE